MLVAHYIRYNILQLRVLAPQGRSGGGLRSVINMREEPGIAVLVGKR